MSLPWFPFYPGDFISGTIRMGFQERGAYALLLNAYYANSGPLPLDKLELHRMVGCESDVDRRVVDRVLDLKFVRTDSGFVHERCEKVIADQTFKHAKRVAAANIRWSNAHAMHEQSICNQNQNQNQRKTKPVGSPAAHPAPEVKRATRFKVESLTEDERAGWLEFCLAERPDLNAGKTLERFTDHWKAKAGKDGAKLDWAATWRNWVRNERQGPNGRAPNQTMGKQMQGLMALERMKDGYSTSVVPQHDPDRTAVTVGSGSTRDTRRGGPAPDSGDLDLGPVGPGFVDDR